LGCEPDVQNLNDGTHVRALSPRPASIGTHVASTAGTQSELLFALSGMYATNKKITQNDIQILRQGRRGNGVKKLQQLLNECMTPSPNLVVDGFFGSLTHQAVFMYQKRIAIAVDGIVGKWTWYHLLKGDKAIISKAATTATAQPEAPQTPPRKRSTASAPVSASTSIAEAQTFPPNFDAVAAAQVLKEAAKSGVPFCEECMKGARAAGSS
jgi:hypothetical protein